MAIHVCPLPALGERMAKSRATHLLSVMGPNDMIDPWPGLEPDRHCRVTVNDIVEASDGLVLAGEAHVTQIIDFARVWARAGTDRRPLIIHCWAGISRSTAAAYIALCALNAKKDEREIARALRDVAPFAKPNGRLIEVADEVLNRKGRMCGAISDLPEAQWLANGVPFHLPANMSA